MVAVRTGGGNTPDTNAQLRSAIERARAFGLPKENIERAITRAAGGEEGAELQVFFYEASAPSGISLLIEGITDNKNRTVAEIKHLLSEYGARLVEPGSLAWNFEKIGILELAARDNPGAAPETIELAIIDSGAADFKKANEGWIVETDFETLAKVRHNLEACGISARATYHDYKPKTTVSVAPAEKERIESLIESLIDHDDVQEVYTNLAE